MYRRWQSPGRRGGTTCLRCARFRPWLGVERLGHRVIERVALGSDRGDGAGFGGPLAVTNRSILDAPVRVVHESLQVWLAPSPARRPGSGSLAPGFRPRARAPGLA